MPQSVPTEWPRAGYQQLLETTHKAVLPKMSVEQIEAYFIQIGSGIVAAAMKKKLKLEKDSGDPINSECECPAGKGPHSTCKHVAAVLLVLQEFSLSGNLQIHVK